MPTYQVFVSRGKLTPAEKQAVAQAITEEHIARTGAPKWYVQVILEEVPEENRFICGRPNSEIMWIRGDVRIRTPEQNRELMLGLVRAVSAVCPFGREDIWIDLCGIEPTNILKLETVFPPAGEERSWQEALPEGVQRRIEALYGPDRDGAAGG